MSVGHSRRSPSGVVKCSGRSVASIRLRPSLLGLGILEMRRTGRDGSGFSSSDGVFTPGEACFCYGKELAAFTSAQNVTSYLVAESTRRRALLDIEWTS